MTVFVVVAAVALSLVLGAVWSLYLPLPDRLKGNALAFGGGALLSSLILELFQPAIDATGAAPAALALLSGAVVFALVDHWVDEVWGSRSGLGLMVAVSLDGLPENLVLGVELIGASARDVAAFATAIVLSNLPESASGAQNMRARGWSDRRILTLWVGAALILSAVTIAGRSLLAGADDATLGLIRAFAAGAIIAALVTELFPQAYRDDDDLTGVSSALGVICAALLSQ
ncbi:putative divalent heavy-metal cations transporter (plasmid) [Marinovum algicola DG 898]|nr:putative divalent heavy-metal cations transporter [Marinovum algicola DG 898]